MTITEVGTGSAALLCTTTLPDCCYSSSGGANGWFFPNGSEIMRQVSQYYRTRAQNPGALLLHRNSEGTTTGIFRCDIPDASNVVQSLHVGIYTNITGESSTLSELLVIFKEISSTPDKDSTFCVYIYTPQLSTICADKDSTFCVYIYIYIYPSTVYHL